MNNKYYVYFLVDPATKIAFYVGKGCNRRAFQHLKETADNNSNPRKYARIEEIRRSGREPLVELRHGGLDEQTAFDLEAQWIKFLGRKGIDPGGILMNIAERGEPLPEESRRRIADKQRGSLNHRWGKKHSEEAKEERRRYNLENGITPPDHTGRKRTEETRRKQSLAARGKPKAAGHRANLSKARKGLKLGPPSKEKIEKLREANKRTAAATPPDIKATRIAKMRATKAATKEERRAKSKAAWDNLPEEVRQERIEKRKATMARRRAERERLETEGRE